MASRKELESKLTLTQRKACLMLVESEIGDPQFKKNQEEIAEELGITRMTLYNWRKDRNFIELKNIYADDFFAEFRPTVYKQLMRLITSPQPSVKAIDLFMRRHGLLTDKQEIVSDSGTNNRSNESIDDELKSLDDQLDDLDI